MLTNAYGGVEDALWTVAGLVGADLVFRGEESYRVTVYVGGYKVGETC